MTLESTITGTGRSAGEPCQERPDLTPNGYFPPLGAPLGTTPGRVPGDGYTWYGRAGGVVPEAPYTPPFVGAAPWHFGSYQVADGGARNPAGWVDYTFGILAGTARCLCSGPGTATVFTRKRYATQTFNAYLQHLSAGGDIITDLTIEDVIPGGGLVIEVPGDPCLHWIRLGDPSHPLDPYKVGAGFDGWEWVGATGILGPVVMRASGSVAGEY